MALSSDVNRKTVGTMTAPQVYPVKAGQVFWKGSIVTMKAGLLYNATSSDNTHVALGVASVALTSTQTSGGDGAANGGADLLVEPGTFGDFTPDAATNNPTFANVMTPIYVLDDDTLSTSSNGGTRCSVTLYSVSDDDNVSLVAQFGQVLP